MSDRLDAVLDHVAIAVPTWEDAERRWKDRLGGGVVAFGKPPVFWSKQLRYANGAKLELLAPPPDAGPDNFVRRFLDRFGAQVHHVTLKVPDLAQALDTLAAAGLDPVDVRMDNAWWHEAFLRPAQVGGLVVQVAWAAQTDEQWAQRVSHEPEPPAPGAMSLIGPLLRHSDLDEARTLWTVLGATVTHTPADANPSADASTDSSEDTLICSWPRSPLTIRITQGTPSGPIALLTDGVELSADRHEGPALAPLLS